MTHKIIFEYFPELVLYSKGTVKDNSRIKVLVYPSKISLRQYGLTRALKRKFLREKSSLNIDLVKKFTGFKSYRKGKKYRLRILPTITIDHKLIWNGKLRVNKELENIADEIQRKKR